MNNLDQAAVSKFLDELAAEIEKAGIDVSELKIDHIAYSASSSEDYEKLLPEFLSGGELVREAIIADRRVAIVKTSNPIIWNKQKIDVIELIEPKFGENAINGWEHAEFLVDSYDELLAKYPNLNWNLDNKDRENFSRIKLTLPNGMEVKFLDTPVLESVKLDK